MTTSTPSSPKDSSGTESRPFRIATWNMDHWKRSVSQRQDAWAYLRSGGLADIALLQESLPPVDFKKTHHAYREIGGSRPWGSSVMSFDDDIEVQEIDTVRSRYSYNRYSMLGTYPGAVMVTRVTLPDVGPITCISVYGLINVYSQTTMLRIVADLIPLFDSPDGQRVILGGDFNVSTAANPRAVELPRYRAILNAVESLGLKNVAKTAKTRPPQIQGCRCGREKCFHLHTYGEAPGTQLDWLYATPELANRCRLIRVEREHTADWSDHSPVVAEFDIPLTFNDKMWEPESMTKEIGIRHGKKAQDVMAELIAWAFRKHEELDRKYRSASLNRLPTKRGNDPEIWVQLDMKRPDRIQYTFSINAKGNIVIQFQYMVAPFDTLEAKEGLWEGLNKIPDIDLARRLKGRPTIPLAALSNPEDLHQFIGRLFMCDGR